MSIELFIKAIEEDVFDYRIEETPTLTYYAASKTLGADDNQSVWIIARSSGANNDQKLEWASAEFDNRWTERESLFDNPQFSNRTSLSFDGINEAARFNDPSLIQFARTDAFSISTWVKPVFNDGSIFAYQGSGSNSDGYSLRIETNGTIGQIQIMIGSGAGNRVQITYDVSTTELDGLFDGGWHLVTWTNSGSSDASGQNLYVDGAPITGLVDNDGLTNEINYGSNVAQYGARHTTTTFAYQGLLDEMSIYGKELSQAEVSEIYGSGFPVDLNQLTSSRDDLISWHRMDGSIFPQIDDLSSVGNDLSLTMINMTEGNFSPDVAA